MKLFELYESPISQGTINLKRIAEAVANKTSTSIDLNNESIQLGFAEAKFLYNLYEKALASGKEDNFLRCLTDSIYMNCLVRAQRLDESTLTENINTLDHIIRRFPKEVKDFHAGNEMDGDLYEALFDYYMLHGEMPYGVAKARTGDPFEWVSDRFSMDMGHHPMEATAHMMESKRDQFGFDVNVKKDDLSFGDVRKIRKGKPEQDLSKYKRTQVKGKSYGSDNQVAEAIDDDDYYGTKPKKSWQKEPEQPKYKTTKVTGHYGKEYQGDDDDLAPSKEDDSKKTVAKPEKEKKGKGRPSAAVKKTDTGSSISDYRTWYHKSKRSHPERKIVGSATKAIAVIPQGKKFAVVGSWEGSKGNIHTSAGEIMTADELAAFKSAKGRPKKIREFIESMRFVVEGIKTREEIRSNLN
jgi:hypothetical protein